MPDILVQRGAGNSQGEDVVEALLTTLPACMARGKAELDLGVSGLQSVALEAIFRPGLRVGQVVEVWDSFSNSVWYGSITSISHSMSGVTIVTNLSVLRVSQFEVGL